jgi:hypothetical protein
MKRKEEILERRRRDAEELRNDLRAYIADRRKEVEHEEKRQRPRSTPEQATLVDWLPTEPTKLDARLAAMDSFAKAREAEIADFETVNGPEELTSAGAMMLVPREDR